MSPDLSPDLTADMATACGDARRWLDAHELDTRGVYQDVPVLLNACRKAASKFGTTFEFLAARTAWSPVHQMGLLRDYIATFNELHPFGRFLDRNLVSPDVPEAPDYPHLTPADFESYRTRTDIPTVTP